MENFKRRLSFRKKKEHVPECNNPHQWQEDEKKVHEGTCSFQVRYLGSIEVFESRGMQVCEEAVKNLKAQCKGKYQRAILYVSGDALRVVDEINKGLIVDQTIEKVSFCAPDRSHDKGFAYICRDGTSRRWMCHGFLTLKESGDRLSHAVGCAFAICLEKKQKLEKESVSVIYNDKGTCFERTGSFRHATLTERLVDPQSAIIAEQIPVKQVENPHAVARPHASNDMLTRQSSFRGFSKLDVSSPFKRQLSLRLNDLPSTLQRQQELSNNAFNQNGLSSSPIPEASPSKEQQDSITEMCQQLTLGLTVLTSDTSGDLETPNQSAEKTAVEFHAPPAAYTATVQGRSVQLPDPIRQNNPWGVSITPPPANIVSTQPHKDLEISAPMSASEAEMWLHSTAQVIASTKLTNQQNINSQQISNGSTNTPRIGSCQTGQNTRSHSFDSSVLVNNPSNNFVSQQMTNQISNYNNGSSFTSPKKSIQKSQADPFESAWSALDNSPSNPFQSDDGVRKTFQVNL